MNMTVQRWRGQFSAHVGFLFSELPFHARFAAAHDAGFTAVEHPSPFKTSAADVRKLLDDCGLTYVQTSFPAGDTGRGEKGFAALPSKRAAFRDSIAPTLDYAAEIGCGMIHAMAGVIPEGVPSERLWDEYIENLSFAADAAAAYGLRILIEPIGPGSIGNYFVADPGMAIRAIAAIDRPNVKLLMDVFHCITVGTEPVAFIRKHAAQIAHVQIADYPGRHEPGSAIVDFRKIFGILDAIAYDGHIGCEYHPAKSTREGLGWMSDRNL